MVATKAKGRVLKIRAEPQDSKAKTIVRTALRPSVQAAVTLEQVNKGTFNLDLLELVDALSDQAKAASTGDLSHAEALLVTQAQTLDGLFHNMTRRAMLNVGEHMAAAETYMKLALKAQAQARATIETLAELKNPRMVQFVNQANIANGPQQVNNTGNVAPAAVAGASAGGKFGTEQTGLLGASDGERMDSRTTSAAGRGDQTLATVDPIHRPAHG